MNLYTDTKISAVNGSGAAWTSPTNVNANDANSASVTIAASGISGILNAAPTQISNAAGNIGVPDTAEILGIQVAVTHLSNTSIIDDTVQLLKPISGVATAVGSNKASSTPWAASTVTYGGPTDLWGTSLTVADIKSGLFSVGIKAKNTDAVTARTASIQYITISVYWRTKKADVPKRYRIRVFNRSGLYLGRFPDASTPYNQSQEINTAGGQIVIDVPVSIDTSSAQSAGTLQDEAGNDLLDELSNPLLTEGATPVIALGTGAALIKNGNKIVVTEYSPWYPNGRIMFRGTIEKWQAQVGGSEVIRVTAYSDGADLSNDLVRDGSNNTTVNYLSLDPSTGMLKSFMDIYASRGGTIGYTTASIDATGLSLTAKITNNTVLDGIKSVMDLSPNGFYWYVEQGSNTLYFKNASTTPDLYLIKGRHMNTFDLTATIENVVNDELFSGGIPSGGTTNLFKEYQDSTSQGLYGRRMTQKSNNAVTTTATADAIGTSDIARQKDESFETTIKLSDSTIDTASLHVGLIVGLRGFGTFVDSIQIQIVRVDYAPEETTITLGIVPKRMSQHTERITRELIALQTIDNPVIPS
jgi:hypothetical protein